ncbi:MAG: large subunit ribosomal protein L23 [Parcubacteria group bacterium Gr01-1014_18]|nr:MAG: large subunit ribosomal protein L23 [Parcubacteria group bacterium Greene0416_36]TSC80254.1 MAG: large subunit ribosomal protein L23 [Parcubacteria group bacterium Gr01-1014_18]TSC98233.1 MAG: large subunit ribosomal protein L23 [Parcubacteria group bacterium Greene1014_20]TSD07024.1 MAG: large subunit ribosomal protein L23 [Parcubacteria group bacterium Greene0714_2]
MPNKSVVKETNSAPAPSENGKAVLAPKKASAGSKMAYRVFVKPLKTEKSLSQSKIHKYIFRVEKSANKIMVKQSIFDLYGVRPVSVNMISVEGKRVGQGHKAGQRKSWKKAIVTLNEKDTIFFE